MRTCSICQRTAADLAAIDTALIRGTPLRDLAAQYGTSTGALVRHRRHISRKVIEDHQRAERARVRNLRSEARVLLERSLALLDRAEDGQDVRAAAAAMREAREFLCLALQLDGELGGAGAQATATVNITTTPEDLQRQVLELFAAEVRGMPPDLRDQVIAWLRQRRRAVLERETAETRERLDAREPKPQFVGNVPALNGGGTSLTPLLAGDPGTGIRHGGDVQAEVLLRRAQAVNWPHLRLTSGRQVAGEVGWRAFALAGTQADIAEAMKALEAVARASDGPAPPSRR